MSMGTNTPSTPPGITTHTTRQTYQYAHHPAYIFHAAGLESRASWPRLRGGGGQVRDSCCFDWRMYDSAAEVLLHLTQLLRCDVAVTQQLNCVLPCDFATD